MAGWRDIVLRVTDHIFEHHTMTIAAGVAFYAFLAIFPALALIVAIYGLVADPQQISRQLAGFGGLVPQEVQSILASQMNSVARGSGTVLSLSGVIAFLLTLWSAASAVKALMDALGAAYSQKETRSFIRFNAVALVLTLGAIVLAVLAGIIIVALPIVLNALRLPTWLQFLTTVLPWLVLAGIAMIAFNIVYRHGPDRTSAKWRWVSWGATFATVLWLIGSLLFSFYVSNFGNYGRVYGAFAAVAILLLWFLLTAFSVLLGAEINAEIEHQTARDTTTGEPRPMGRRGAYVADTLGEKR